MNLNLYRQVQFVIALVHSALPFFFDCGFQPFFAYVLMGHAVLFWVMFYNFYSKNYKRVECARPNGTTSGYVRVSQFAFKPPVKKEEVFCSRKLD